MRQPGPAGSLLIVESNRTIPLVHVVIASRSGSAADPRHREGLTNLAAEWARRGAGGKSREEIDAALDALGATLEVTTLPDSTRFEGEVLARNLDAYLAPAGRHPRAPELRRPPSWNARAARWWGRSTSSATTTARWRGVSSCATSSPTIPTAIPPTACRPRSRPRARRRSARTFADTSWARTWCSRSRATSSADALAAGLKRAFRGLTRRPAAGANALELREPVPPKGWRIQLVDKPDRQQTQLLFGHPGVRATDPDFLPLTLGLAAFGGHAMNATLMNEVRRKRGLAYGAYLTLSERRGVGAATGWVFSGSDKTVTTLKLVLRLYVAFMEKGVGADEVAFFKRFLIGTHASEMDVPEHRLAARVSAEIAGLPADFVDSYPGRA